MFPADVRYSGSSLGFQLASVFAGGLAPLIMTALIAATGQSRTVSFYILAMTAISWVAVFTIRERFRANLHQTSEDIAAEAASPLPSPSRPPMPGATLEERITRLEGLHAIQQLRAQYCQYLDDGRWE